MREQREHYHIAGYRLETVWHGPGPADAPTVIFLHEGLGCVDMWQSFPRRVAAQTGCGALVYSRSGYGRSDPCSLPRDLQYMTEEGRVVLPELIETLGIRDCVLVGNSDGGSIALVYAGGTEAGPLRGVITEAAHVFCEEITVRSIEQATDSYRSGVLKAKLGKYHGENTDTAFWGWSDAWLHPDFMNWNIEGFLPGIRVPVLVTQGEADQYGTRDQVEAIARGIPAGAEIMMIPECNHWPHLEYPEMMLGVMSSFIFRIFK